MTSTPVPIPAAVGFLTRLDALAAKSEEENWLAKRKSAQIRRAHWLDVRHLTRALGIITTDALRQVDHRNVNARERLQREQEGAAASPIRRRLAALSSLFKHEVRRGAALRNPVVDLERPTINRAEGSTASFSRAGSKIARRVFGGYAGRVARPFYSVGWVAGWIPARRSPR